MVINTNTSASQASRMLSQSTSMLQKSLARLSSGSRLVSAEDDSAGLAQSIKLDAQMSRNRAAQVNVGNATSFAQTQDGFLGKVQKALDRMSELTVLAQDSTKTTTDLSNYTSEFTQLQNFISDIGSKTFNDVGLFASSSLAVTIDSDGLKFTMNGVDFSGTSLAASFQGTTAITSSTAAATALTTVKSAIQTLANMRANVGANIQRLNLTNENISVLNENLSAATSRIKDVDVAQESTAFARYNILVQSGTAMLAQANAVPQSALRLLG
jgi:flagellin